VTGTDFAAGTTSLTITREHAAGERHQIHCPRRWPANVHIMSHSQIGLVELS